MFDQTGPKVQGHDRVCSPAALTADVCHCFFTVVMLCFSDIISIIEDREHLTSLISLSDTPHEIEGLAKVNKDTCHTEISLCHHHQSHAFHFNTCQWKDGKRRESSPIKAEKRGLYLYI